MPHHSAQPATSPTAMSPSAPSPTAPGTPPALPRTAHDVPYVFAARFNAGDPDAVQEMYAPDAVFVPPDGVPATTSEEIRRANAAFLALGLPITVRPRQVRVAGDTALLVVDWELGAGEGEGGDGGGAHDAVAGPVRGTATDVARRGPDGCWRYLIDSPFGGGPA
ncbi:YybH family protein [Streptomyces nigrescens]|uniref:YybH family protein n=1 Tax=Streptomyces nigrescens TaxID=1920 RepID=UPI0029056F80|nr:nuclear transport factor 2 family protein [Streptomyces nigrescens]